VDSENIPTSLHDAWALEMRVRNIDERTENIDIAENLFYSGAAAMMGMITPQLTVDQDLLPFLQGLLDELDAYATAMET
jgi:hypothetical protein